MKYLLMMNSPGKRYEVTSWPREALLAHIDFMKRFARRLKERGVLVAAEGLADPSEAKLVRGSPSGEPVTDGVFPESKEFLAGYWFIEVDSAQEAYRIAAEASVAPGPGGAPLYLPIEVRQVMSAPPTEQ